MYVHVNPNPYGNYVDDCVIRAISIATDHSWDYTYVHVCLQGYIMKNMPSVGAVWGTYLSSMGFVHEQVWTGMSGRNSYSRGGYNRSSSMGYGNRSYSSRRYYDGDKESSMNDLRQMISMEQDPEKRSMLENIMHTLEGEK